MKYQRQSQERIDCAGLERFLRHGDDLNAITGQIVLPLLKNMEIAKRMVSNAYREWMEYMTRIVWQSVLSLLSCLR